VAVLGFCVWGANGRGFCVWGVKGDFCLGLHHSDVQWRIQKLRMGLWWGINWDL